MPVAVPATRTKFAKLAHLIKDSTKIPADAFATTSSTVSEIICGIRRLVSAAAESGAREDLKSTRELVSASAARL